MTTIYIIAMLLMLGIIFYQTWMFRVHLRHAQILSFMLIDMDVRQWSRTSIISRRAIGKWGMENPGKQITHDMAYAIIHTAVTTVRDK